MRTVHCADIYRYNIQIYIFYFAHVTVATSRVDWRAVAYPAQLGALPVAAAGVLCVCSWIGCCDEGSRTCRRKNVFPPRAGTEPKRPDDIAHARKFSTSLRSGSRNMYYTIRALFPHISNDCNYFSLISCYVALWFRLCNIMILC